MKNKHVLFLMNLLKSLGAGAAIMTLLTACTPGDVSYCEGMGIAQGNPEYSSCIQYYRQQSALFGGDYSRCSTQADMSYPSSLYDQGHQGYVNTFDPVRRAYVATPVQVPPDAQHNAEVNTLRSRIIQPCMDSLGWNSSDSWMAGRHPVAAARTVAPSAIVPLNPAPLPWQR